MAGRRSRRWQWKCNYHQCQPGRQDQYHRRGARWDLPRKHHRHRIHLRRQFDRSRQRDPEFRRHRHLLPAEQHEPAFGVEHTAFGQWSGWHRDFGERLGTVMTGVLDHVVSENNAIDGIAINSEGSATVNVTISDSVSANNATDGIVTSVLSGSVTVMVQDSTISNKQRYRRARAEWQHCSRYAVDDYRKRHGMEYSEQRRGVELRRQQHRRQWDRQHRTAEPAHIQITILDETPPDARFVSRDRLPPGKAPALSWDLPRRRKPRRKVTRIIAVAVLSWGRHAPPMALRLGFGRDAGFLRGFYRRSGITAGSRHGGR